MHARVRDPQRQPHLEHDAEGPAYREVRLLRGVAAEAEQVRAGGEASTAAPGMPYRSRTARISGASEMSTPVNPSSPRSRPLRAAADSVAGRPR